jgi:hypothetical protein
VSAHSPVPAPPPPRSTAEARIADQPDQPTRPDLDALVSGLDDLADRPVAEHHDRLAQVHEALHTALHSGLPEQPDTR